MYLKLVAGRCARIPGVKDDTLDCTERSDLDLVSAAPLTAWRWSMKSILSQVPITSKWTQRRLCRVGLVGVAIARMLIMPFKHAFSSLSLWDAMLVVWFSSQSLWGLIHVVWFSSLSLLRPDTCCVVQLTVALRPDTCCVVQLTVALRPDTCGVVQLTVAMGFEEEEAARHRQERPLRRWRSAQQRRRELDHVRDVTAVHGPDRLRLVYAAEQQPLVTLARAKNVR